MKARAWLIMLLISLVSFTGFGYSTPDLTKNSTVVTVDSDIVGVDNVIAIVVNNDFNVNENKSYVFSKSKDVNLDIKVNYEKPIKENILIPPLRQIKTIFNIKTLQKLKSENYLLNYRRARDGISCNFS